MKIDFSRIFLFISLFCGVGALSQEVATWENFSVFSRLQRRYSLLSDIFLNYNQNNDTNGFDLRSQSIILKLTHRFAV